MPFIEDTKGFNNFHVRPIEPGNLKVDEQETNTAQYFPNNGISGAKIESLSVSKLTAGSINVEEYIQSTGFVSGTTGWQIKGDGTAEFVGITLSGGVFRYGKTDFTDSINAGYYFGSEGMYIGSAGDTTLLKYTVASGLFDFVGTISSRATSTIASAINAAGNLITDVVNARLDSSAKSILSDFEFDSVDYSGGIKCGTITWNTATGAITGGSGGVFHKGGLLFANGGVATITLDGATGNATFGGTLSAPTGSLGTLSVLGELKAGSVIVLHNCDTFNGNGTWLAAYDAENITTDATEFLEGSGSINFDIDVSNGAENYGEVYVPDMASVDLSFYEDIGVFRVWIFLPNKTHITQINLNWGSTDSDGWTNTATTQANGDAFVSGWNQVQFNWSGAGTFGTGDASDIKYLAVRLTYDAAQADMYDCRIDYIACYDPRGSFRTYASGNKGGMLMNYFGIEGYNLKNVKTTEINAETGKITARDIVVTAKAGSNIWSPITLTGYFAGMGNTGYSTKAVSLNTAENSNGDVALIGYTNLVGRIARWRQLSSTATSAIALYNSHTGSTGPHAAEVSGIIKIGSYFYTSFVGDLIARVSEDLSASSACAFVGTSGYGPLSYDATNSYLLILDGTTAVKRYTIAGTNITYVDTITLSTALTSRTPAFMYDGEYYWGYSAGTMYKYDKVGTVSGSLSTGETDSVIIKGLIKLQGILYLAIESREKLENNGFIKQQYINQLVPINSF